MTDHLLAASEQREKSRTKPIEGNRGGLQPICQAGMMRLNMNRRTVDMLAFESAFDCRYRLSIRCCRHMFDLFAVHASGSE